MQEFLMNPIVAGAVAGAVSAAAIDFQAFRSWKSYQEVATYDWGTATFRWVQGAIVGAVATTGYGALLG